MEETCHFLKIRCRFIAARRAMNSTLPRQPNTSSGSTSRPVQAERSTPSRGNKTFGSSMSSEEAEASGWVTVAKEVSADGVRQEGRKKDPKNAERCRASRQKRKALILQEKAVNASLKLQRTTLLKRIADLEQTVQELRGQNAVNLQKENELLAAEVQVRMRFIPDKIVFQFDFYI